jgi:ubiquinone/menaquinone biosynthesis C-methylase UbiE
MIYYARAVLTLANIHVGSVPERPAVEKRSMLDNVFMYEDASAADVYDLIYQDRKDYGAEAATVAALIRARRPDAASILDVACGTGAHLEEFARHFRRAEGVDLSESMSALARRRLPGVPLHRGDMRSFRIDARFDAVVCMFSSIGYLSTTEDLDRALSSMSRHLTPGGVVVVEPWWTPETFADRYVSGHVVTRDGRTVARVSHSTRDGDVTRMEIHYLVADGEGIRHHSEIDRLTLYTAEQYEDAFVRAGAKVEYVPNAGPGYYVGVWP